MSTFSWSFERDLALWSSMGVCHAGLHTGKLAEDTEGKMTRLATAGINATTLIVPPFDLADPASWDETRVGHRAAIDLMASHGGRSIYFTPGRTTGRRWEEDLDLFAQAVAPTVAHARAAGIPAAIEPSLRTSLSFVNTLRDAVDVAERTGVALVADFGNMWMERGFRDMLKQAAPHLALVQICDVIVGTRANPPLGGRAHIGTGELPVRRMIEDVISSGYDGLFDLEVVAADYREPCREEELRAGIRAASDLLDMIGL